MRGFKIHNDIFKCLVIIMLVMYVLRRLFAAMRTLWKHLVMIASECWSLMHLVIREMEVCDCPEDGPCLLDGYEASMFYDVGSTHLLD